MRRRNKKVCTTLYYIEHFVILASAIIGCISISVFASLLGIPIGMTSSAIGSKICAKAAGIKKYKPIIKKKKNFALINNVLNEYDNMKEEIKNLKN